MTKRHRQAMVMHSASNSASASGLSLCLERGTFCCWSIAQAVIRAVAEFIGVCEVPRTPTEKASF